MSSDEVIPSAIDVGMKDRKIMGWGNGDTGELVRKVFIKPGMKVVDIGCGDGGYIRFCSQMGADVTFVDLQEEKVRAVESRLQDVAKGEVKGIVSDCSPIPLPDEHADLVMSTEVLEHIRNPQEFLQEIVRIGKPDATYLLTVPDARGENLVKPVAHPSYFKEPNHIQVFTAKDFENLAVSCGLEVIHHEFISGFWSIFFLLKWATSLPDEGLGNNVHPTTINWTRCWEEVLKHPKGGEIQAALNQAVPHTQLILARRSGANVG